MTDPSIIHFKRTVERISAKYDDLLANVELRNEQLFCLRASHDRLLAAAKMALTTIASWECEELTVVQNLRAAIAAAEEHAP